MNASRELTLPGQEVYFDTLVIKFDDHFIEQGDPLKGHALMVYSGGPSPAPCGPKMASSSTRKARRPDLRRRAASPQAELREGALETLLGTCQRRKTGEGHGVRAIHGDAPYMHLEPDRVYEVSLRSRPEKSSLRPERLGWDPRKGLLRSCRTSVADESRREAHESGIALRRLMPPGLRL